MTRKAGGQSSMASARNKTPKSDQRKPFGYILIRGEAYGVDQMLSSHGSIEDAIAQLPGKVVGSLSKPFNLGDWYDIVDVSTLKTVKTYYWKLDCSGAPVFHHLVEEPIKNEAAA